MSSSADQTVTDQEDTGKSAFWSGFLKPVFIPASLIIFAMIALSAVAASDSERIFGALNTWITEGVGWWYILIVTVFVVFAFYCGFSSIGSIRLGKDG